MPALPIGVAAGVPAGDNRRYELPDSRGGAPSVGSLDRPRVGLLVAGTAVWVGMVITPGVIAISVARPGAGRVAGDDMTQNVVITGASAGIARATALLIGY